MATTIDIVREEPAEEIARLRVTAAVEGGQPALLSTFVPPTNSANE